MRFSALIILYLVSAAFNFSLGQDFHLEQEKKEHSSLLFGFSNELFSKNLSNKFFKNYWSGSFISNEEKDEVIINLDAVNRLGWRTDFSLTFENRKSQRGFGLRLGAELNSFTEAAFAKDAFALYFKGNKSFEGKTATLAPLRIFSYQYAAINLGAYLEKTNWGAQVDVGFLNGLHYLDHSLEQGSLYTEEYGRSLELKAQLNSYDNEPGKNTFGSSKMIGIKTDISLFLKPAKNTKVFVRLKDLGSISWNGIIRERKIDTFYVYEGTEVTNLLDSFAITGKGISELESDFLRDRYGLDRNTALPFLWELGIFHSLFNEKLRICFKTGKVDSKNADQFYDARFSYVFIPDFIAAGLSWKKGSYGTHGLGLFSEINLFGSLRLLLGFESFQSWIDTKRSLDLSGYSSIKFEF